MEIMAAETNFLIRDIVTALNNIDKWMAPEYVHKDLANKFNDAYILPEPLGVMLNLSPWNYPLQLSLGPLIGAIAAGKYHKAPNFKEHGFVFSKFCYSRMSPFLINLIFSPRQCRHHKTVRDIRGNFQPPERACTTVP